MSDDHNMNQTDSGWRKRQIALDKKAENARELGLDYDVHSCSPFCDRPMCVAVREAVQVEREACAKVCEENAIDLSEGDWDSACNNCADLIRARSNT